MNNNPYVTREELKRIIYETAPLVEGEQVLLDWLRKNGITFANTPQGFRFLDMRPGREGMNIEDAFLTYSEALLFALEFVKLHLQADEASVGVK